MIDALIERLRSSVKGSVRTDVPLAPFTTYRLGGKARVMVEPSDEEDLGAVGSVLAETASPILVVGRGSNLVISDHGFDGVCVHLGRPFAGIEGWDPPDALARSGAVAGGATSMPLLANWTVRRGLAGFEWAVGVPGSVGGGVRMNAGAHSGEIADTLVKARIWDLRSPAEPVERTNEELGFSYRRSNVRDDELVVMAWFRFEQTDIEAVRARAETLRLKRAETQPGAAQNAGSVFKNPEGDHAGRLVEAAGLKGFQVGGARVSEVHANFFIAPEGTRSQDVYDLVTEVRRRVYDHSGIELQTEIRFVGRFEEGS